VWFAIGRSHMSDRLSHPRGSKRVIRGKKRCYCKREGELFWLKIMMMHNNDDAHSLIIYNKTTKYHKK